MLMTVCVFILQYSMALITLVTVHDQTCVTPWLCADVGITVVTLSVLVIPFLTIPCSSIVCTIYAITLIVFRHIRTLKHPYFAPL